MFQWAKLRKLDTTQCCQRRGRGHHTPSLSSHLIPHVNGSSGLVSLPFTFSLKAQIQFLLFPIQRRAGTRMCFYKALYEWLRNNKCRVWRVTFTATKSGHLQLDSIPKFSILLLIVCHETRPAYPSPPRTSRSLPFIAP